MAQRSPVQIVGSKMFARARDTAVNLIYYVMGPVHSYVDSASTLPNDRVKLARISLLGPY